VVRAPGLEPKSSGKEMFSLLRDLAIRCLEDIRKGRTATSRQLLSMLWGVERMTSTSPGKRSGL